MALGSPEPDSTCAASEAAAPAIMSGSYVELTEEPAMTLGERLADLEDISAGLDAGRVSMRIPAESDGARGRASRYLVLVAVVAAIGLLELLRRRLSYRTKKLIARFWRAAKPETKLKIAWSALGDQTCQS